MKLKAGKLKTILVWLILASGLAIVTLDHSGLSIFSSQVSVLARTVFWISVIAYFWLRVFGKLSQR